ncbi:Uricase [Sesamum alatum]|uniref:Uricase n=1 Tax=Sesamum alatum TaxID=300844 RepID=A0AAE2CXM9_9LAMI|nr:Uricase [Sesamum alatum]
MLALEVTSSWRCSLETLASIPAKQLYFTEKYIDLEKVLIGTITWQRPCLRVDSILCLLASYGSFCCLQCFPNEPVRSQMLLMVAEVSCRGNIEVSPCLESMPVAPESHPTLAQFQDAIAYNFKI